MDDLTPIDKIKNDCPHEIAVSRIVPVKEDEVLRIGAVLKSKIKLDINQEINCGVLFLNGQGEPIDEKDNLAIFCQPSEYQEPLSKSNECAYILWSDILVTAPKLARSVILNLIVNPRSLEDTRAYLLCANSSKQPIFGQVFDLTPKQSFGFSVSFERKTQGRNIALLSLTYFDSSFGVLSDSVVGFSKSERFGHFKYIHCNQNGDSPTVILLPPSNACFAYIEIHPLVQDSTLKLRKPPTFRVESKITSFWNNPEWHVVGDRKPILDVQIKEEIESETLVVASVRYMSLLRSDRVFGTLSLHSADSHSRDVSSSNQGLISLNGTDGISVERRLYIDDFENSRSLSFTFSNTDNAIGFVNDVTINTVGPLKGEWGAIVNDEILNHTFQVFPYWSGLLQVQAPVIDERIELKWEIQWFDKSGTILDRTTGELHAVDRNIVFQNIEPSLRACYANTMTGTKNVTLLQIVVEFEPAPNANYAIASFLSSCKLRPLKIEYRIHPFISLNLAKLDQSAISDIVFLKSASLPAMKSTMIALLNKFPKDKYIHATSLRSFIEMEDVPNTILVSKKVGKTFKDIELCRFARQVLAMLRITELGWLPCDFPIEPQKPIEQNASRGISMAMLTSNHESAERAASNLSVFQACGCLQLGGFSIELSQNSKKSEAGRIFELENIGGLRNYRMNCIDSDDLALIPIDTRLEFVTNVVSYIFQQETVSVIHVSLDDDATENVLIGLALARRFSIPLILEVRALPRHFNRIGITDSDTVFEQLYIKKIYKCIAESAAVVTHRQSMKDELIEFGVLAENVFVLPTDKILESENFSIDNSNVTAIYQKAYLWALGNIANL